MNVNQKLDTLIDQYGDGADGNAPTRAQWRRILERDPAEPLTLVNFFKFRDIAEYDGETDSTLTGQEAFTRYADVSMPSMHAAGGEFLAVAPFSGNMMGKEQDWDLVAIGKYPNLEAFLALYENPSYVDAFAHRSAAVQNQTVVVLG